LLLTLILVFLHKGITYNSKSTVKDNKNLRTKTVVIIFFLMRKHGAEETKSALLKTL